MKRDEIVAKLQEKKEYFVQKYGIEIVGLFGSYARGEEKKESDIDILYVYKGTKHLGLFGLLKMIDELEKIFQKKIDLIPLEKLKPIVKKSVEEDMIYV